MNGVMHRITRSSGVLMPVFSLPSPHGIGTLGKEAFKFVDSLKDAGQTYWQILPLGPTGYGASPYQTYSSCAGNPLLIDEDSLLSSGLLSLSDIFEYDKALPADSVLRVPYDVVEVQKMQLLNKAFHNASKSLLEEVNCFKEENISWLSDYALFMAIKEHFGNVAVWDWSNKNLIRREPAELAKYADLLKDRIDFFAFVQYQFFKQWSDLKAYANQNGIFFIGDIPIYPSPDSADVWASSHLFKVDEDLKATGIAGVPPDIYSKTGQLWGNPVYEWDKHRDDGFKWWIWRIKQALKTADVIRIDHFRAFQSYWEIPFGSKTAMSGNWVDGPRMELFNAIKSELGEVPIIAEDLGIIGDDVVNFVKETGYPGMKVLIFAMQQGQNNIHLPYNWIPNCVGYTSTHDSSTFKGELGRLSNTDLEFMLNYLNCQNLEKVGFAAIRAAFSSPANLVIVPIGDILGLSDGARINVPGTVSPKNWSWRMIPKTLSNELIEDLYLLTETYSRIN